MIDSLSTLKTAIDMYQAQYAATDKLWSYFSTVPLAFVAYTISSDKVSRIFPEAIAAICAYLIFCAGNFAALSAAQLQLFALAEIVKTYGKPHNLDPNSFKVFTNSDIALFYGTLVSIIVLISLGLAWHRSHRKNIPQPPPAS